MSIIGIERIERDASQVVEPAGGEAHGIVLQVPFGPIVPALITNPEDLFTFFTPEGIPDPTYKDYYEAEILVKQAQLIAVRPQGDALFGGVTVEETGTGNATEALDTPSGGVGIQNPNSYTFADNLKQFVIISADPSADNNNYSVKILATTSEVANTFDIDLLYKGSLVANFNVSLVRTQLDGFGTSVYIEEVIKQRSDIQVIVNTSADLTVLPEFNSSAVTFGGGVTITDFSNTADTIIAWNFFKEFNRYYTHYLVDTSANAVIGKAVESIARVNFYQHVYCAAPSIKSSNARATETLNTWLTGVLDYRDINGIDLNLNSDHISLHANWGEVPDTVNNTTVWISPAAAFAARKAYTLQNISISEAAVGPNENRGVASEFIQLEQDPTELNDQLDSKQINFLTYSSAGILCWGERTLQTFLSNTSYISHRTWFNFLEESIENVLFTFVFTDINEGTRATVRSLVESFTDPQIGPHAEDIQVRVPRDDALAALRKFKVQVAVIPFPKANKIIFEFIHSKAGTDLNEVF